MQLPIDDVLPQIIASIRSASTLIIKATPGAGKTTRVPIAIAHAGLLNEKQLLLLEPRRMAARAAAEFMAEGLGEKVGQTVGYRIRFENKESANTKILVVTEGILTRRFATDPLLEGISVVVLDEFHERSVHTDLCLAFIKELQTIRDDLKLVVMSATLDEKPLQKWLGNCPVIEAEGRTFPLRIENEPLEDKRPIYARAARAALNLYRKATAGNVLVFLSGAGDIARTEQELRRLLIDNEAVILPLYSALPLPLQQRVLQQSGERRIILSTNIAETSLTIPGVIAVVDSGEHKQVRWQPGSGLSRLETVSISKNSATQRAGRAGRTAPGRVFRLWTAHSDKGRVLGDVPEIARVDSAPLLVQILLFHPGNPADFDMFFPIPEAGVEAGISLLRQLGAVSLTNYSLTSCGRELATLPLHPRLGAIVQKAKALGCINTGIALAALLEEQDILSRDAQSTSATGVGCDVSLRLNLLQKFEHLGATPEAATALGIRFYPATSLLRSRNQLERLFESSHNTFASIPIAHLLLAGFPDRVCAKSTPGETHAQTAGGSQVSLDERSEVKNELLFLAIDGDAGNRGMHARHRVTLASAISLADLEAVFPHMLRCVTSARFDRVKEQVVGESEKLFGTLVLERKTGVRVSDNEAAAVLAQAANVEFERIFKPDNNAILLMNRIRYAAQVRPELSWPPLDESALRALLPLAVKGFRSFEQLKQAHWEPIVFAQLDHQMRAALDAEFPAFVIAPTGTKLTVDYGEGLKPGKTPSISVRMQEVFGMSKTPRIGNGRVPLTLSLLSPAGRPVQVTSDLASFWKNTWPTVRKELRSRYPRHHWPDDPLSAAPVSRPKKRR